MLNKIAKRKKSEAHTARPAQAFLMHHALFPAVPLLQSGWIRWPCANHPHCFLNVTPLFMFPLIYTYQNISGSLRLISNVPSLCNLTLPYLLFLLYQKIFSTSEFLYKFCSFQEHNYKIMSYMQLTHFLDLRLTKGLNWVIYFVFCTKHQLFPHQCFPKCNIYHQLQAR